MNTLEHALAGELVRHIEIIQTAPYMFEATLFEQTAANGDIIIATGNAERVRGAINRLILALESINGI